MTWLRSASVALKLITQNGRASPRLYPFTSGSTSRSPYSNPPHPLFFAISGSGPCPTTGLPTDGRESNSARSRKAKPVFSNQRNLSLLPFDIWLSPQASRMSGDQIPVIHFQEGVYCEGKPFRYWLGPCANNSCDVSRFPLCECRAEARTGGFRSGHQKRTYR